MLARSLKTLSLGGSVTLGTSAMTGPSGIFSRSCLTLPPKDKVFNDLASMIQQFKLFSDGFQAPKGEIYCGTEAAKGELGFYIVSDGGGKPYRLKIRAPSFIHMGAFDFMARGYMIADIVPIFGTYDIVMGECDR